MENANDTSDRELSISRLFDAPVELMWEVWTNPNHIKNWWGPDGFTNTISQMDVKPEGEWYLVMHGPDGTDYNNHSVFKEVVLHKKLVYEHVSGPNFIATGTFEARGNKTFLHWKSVFKSREQMIEVVKKFKADEGMKQNVDRMEAYIKLNFKRK
jgi:uncharacterized protein YndB with AHSA1/START domain